MGNYLNRFCGGTGSHEEFNYMPVVRKQDGQFEQICQGWIMVQKLPDTDEDNSRNQDTEEFEES